MLLSSNVIKQVSYELENCSVYPNNKLLQNLQEISPNATPDLEIVKPAGGSVEAEAVIKSAQEKAGWILQQTRERIASLEKEAYSKGYSQGEKDAWEALEKSRQDFHVTTRDILHELEKMRDDLYRQTEADLIDLAIKMAEKLVCRQLAVEPDTIVDIAREACHQARDCKEVVLYVPARQMENIVAQQDQLNGQLYKTKHFAIRPDPKLYGGCRIETEQGYIDASTETMAEQLHKLFVDESK